MLAGSGGEAQFHIQGGYIAFCGLILSIVQQGDRVKMYLSSVVIGQYSKPMFSP